LLSTSFNYSVHKFFSPKERRYHQIDQQVSMLHFGFLTPLGMAKTPNRIEMLGELLYSASLRPQGACLFFYPIRYSSGEDGCSNWRIQ
jgi:hypothetical protein